MNRFLPNELASRLALQLPDSELAYEYEYEKHRVFCSEPAEAVEKQEPQEPVVFRLPITLPPPQADGKFRVEPITYVILLIQSGHCSLGLFEGLKNYDHKVIRAYMVRKKQGTSQVKYLKTKGKSRAGSRVRLAGTTEFFEEINERLQSYFGNYKIDRIAISCSKILLPFLFNSKVEAPFGKKDERLYKIPRHVHTPKFEELMDVQKFLARGELIYSEEQLPLVEKLLSEVH